MLQESGAGAPGEHEGVARRSGCDSGASRDQPQRRGLHMV